MNAKIQGEVDVEFVVRRDGTVGDARVTKSLDPGGLDEEAVKALRQWLFKPGELNGRPVAVRLQAQLMFTLR
jgi:TonB family protein